MWRSPIRAVQLQHLEGEGVGLYLAVSSFHLPRLAEVVEGLVGHKNTKTSSSLLSSRGRYNRLHWTLLPSRVAA